MMKLLVYVCFCTSMLIISSISYAGNLQKSTSDDQTAVNLTVYSDIALIKDVRNIKLEKGAGELRFMDVASTIVPETVLARSLNYPDKFSVIEQNYEYDLINADKLLDKYVGKKIKIIDWNKFQDRKESVDAILLSNNGGQIYKIENEIFIGHPGYKVLPEMPENLIAKPTLMWMYDNSEETVHNVEASYIASGISWKADYVLALNEADTLADLSGWVTLNNRSGATYKNAGLKLVAGKINRVRHQVQAQRMVMMDMVAESKSSQFQEKAFSEYHMYNLQRKTTVKENQTKQISFLEAFGTKIKKEYVVNGNSNRYYSRQYSRGGSKKEPVNVYFVLKNSKDNNLGMPLPAGTMRVYKNDEDSSLQFIGEDNIEHTPKDEEVKIKTGEAFDVVAERVQVDYKEIRSRVHESEWEITLRNHKAKDVVVDVVEPLSGNWKVISNSHPYEKVDAFTIKFKVDVPKDGEVIVKYRLRVGLE